MSITKLGSAVLDDTVRAVSYAYRTGNTIKQKQQETEEFNEKLKKQFNEGVDNNVIKPHIRGKQKNNQGPPETRSSKRG